jgi:heavy metal translocating P-type ATPase
MPPAQAPVVSAPDAPESASDTAAPDTAAPDAAVPSRVRELSIGGLDCASCASVVQSALEGVPGVTRADVRLVSSKAVVTLDPDAEADEADLRRAVERAGYDVQDDDGAADAGAMAGAGHSRRALGVLVGVVAAVLGIALVGHGLGVFEQLQQAVPWYVGGAVALVAGLPTLRKVGAAALAGRVTPHTLMTVGMAAALAAGEWVTALVIVGFMHVGDYVEGFTTERARTALRDLMRQAPQTARVRRGGEATEVPVGAVRPGEVVIVRPGERIPVDGTVVRGHAFVSQAALTGEPMPVEAAPGTDVFAATVAEGGSLRVRTDTTGEDTAFGRVIRLVEEAEAQKGHTQRWADRFSALYLPVVAAVAATTYLASGSLSATVAVLVVACSCAFALATPVALLATIGRLARQGVLVKGGRTLEALAGADVLLVDKTGTLTLGAPEITRVVALDGFDDDALVRLAASVERDAEHPLADAVRRAARARGLSVPVPMAFEALPGRGVQATVEGRCVRVGNRRLVEGAVFGEAGRVPLPPGATPLFVEVEGQTAGVLLAEDAARPGVADALDAVRAAGLTRVEVLTGDRAEAAAVLGDWLDVPVRAELLPEDKIARVKELQAEGHTVVMIGDGVNDAPALAQANAGIAMGRAGTDLATESADVVLMREDWALVPHLFDAARRTLGVIKGNLVFTGVYNLAALGAAAVGVLPPILAAALHAVPDLGILANSSRLLRRDADASDDPTTTDDAGFEAVPVEAEGCCAGEGASCASS